MVPAGQPAHVGGRRWGRALRRTWYLSSTAAAGVCRRRFPVVHICKEVRTMSERLTRFFASRRDILLAGAVIGLLALLRQKAGNPPSMGICIACFGRDIAGALGLHRASAVQYIRPEIIPFVLNFTMRERRTG